MRHYQLHSQHKPLRGSIHLPGDKSIAHRALILSALAAGRTHIRNLPDNQDCRATINVLRSLGVIIRLRKEGNRSASFSAEVLGQGAGGFKQPQEPVFVGDSGTTLRLSLGLVAGLPLCVKFNAGVSLSRRPMRRVCGPLRLMGACIRGSRRTKGSRGSEEYAPLLVRPAVLKGISYRPKVASAQVKSALLLAALAARGTTVITEAIPTRDHTERMLSVFGIKLQRGAGRVALTGPLMLLSPGSFTIPGDISSAAFFMVLATILPQSVVTLKDICLNPSRMGVVRVLQRMGGRITVKRARSGQSGGEPRGDICVRSARLRGATVSKGEIPQLIDELPILMVAACFARGTTCFKHVNELRVKETDRIVSMTRNLKAMGAQVLSATAGASETIRITGGGGLSGAAVKSYGDHRTAMSMIVAGLAACGKTQLDEVGCIEKSFPEFRRTLSRLFNAKI